MSGLLTVDIEGLDRLEALALRGERILQDGMRRAVDAACREGAEEARKGRFKDHSGDLRGAIRGYLVRASNAEAEGVIEAPVMYASFVEEGTQPHDIWPKEGGGFVGPLRSGQSRRKKTDIGTHRVALRWQGPGGTHFARMVHHPGGQPSPFMGPAYLKAERVLEREMEVAAERVAAMFDRL